MTLLIREDIYDVNVQTASRTRHTERLCSDCMWVRKNKYPKRTYRGGEHVKGAACCAECGAVNKAMLALAAKEGLGDKRGTQDPA